jgi:undecaprenyl diphosphate synthase
MGLLLKNLEDEIFMKNNVRFRVIGDKTRLPEDVQEKMNMMIERTAKNDAMTLVLALSYSARWELTHAMQEIAREGFAAEDITEDVVAHTCRPPSCQTPSCSSARVGSSASATTCCGR